LRGFTAFSTFAAYDGALDELDTGANTRDGGLRRRRIPRPNARGSR
jgi:hypothetical protein